MYRNSEAKPPDTTMKPKTFAEELAGHYSEEYIRRQKEAAAEAVRKAQKAKEERIEKAYELCQESMIKEIQAELNKLKPCAKTIKKSWIKFGIRYTWEEIIYPNDRAASDAQQYLLRQGFKIEDATFKEKVQTYSNGKDDYHRELELIINWSHHVKAEDDGVADVSTLWGRFKNWWSKEVNE